MTKFLNISTDNTLGGASPSDVMLSSQKAVKEYVDNNISGGPQSIDADIVGALTVASNSDVSGLSNNNYLLFPGALDMSNASSFEMVFAFTTKSTLGSGSILGNTSIYEHNARLRFSSNNLYFQVFSGTNNIHLTGTTTLTGSTKYYAKVVYDGTDYTLYLSTDGSTWNTEGTLTATYLPGAVSQPYSLGRGDSPMGWGVSIMHMSECYIKKDGVVIWQGLDAPGLRQRASSLHEVIEFQVPTSTNNYTWYRKYRDGWVEQGGVFKVSSNAGGTNTVINLPITMTNEHYTAILGLGDSNTANTSVYMWVCSKSTTSFTVISSLVNNTATESGWQVSGMAS